MIPEQDYATVEAMETFGCSFVKALAVCLRHADQQNYAKLKSTFPLYFEQYRQMAERKGKKL